MSTPHQPQQGGPSQWRTGQAAAQQPGQAGSPTPGQPTHQGQSAQPAAQQQGQGNQPAQQAQQPAQQGRGNQPAQQAQQPAQQGRGNQAAQQGQSNQPAAQQQGQGNQPARQRSSWSTPRLLRLARAGAAAAVLLTGVAATGTFSTDGLNSTPDVIAQQWVAAERAGVEMAHADLRAAQRVADGDPAAARDAFDEAVTQVGTDLTSSGMSRVEAGEVSRDWSAFVVGAERAAAGAGDVSPGDGYADASAAARSAAERTDAAAEQHAQDLRTGSRSVLTGIVGTVATLGLVGLLVWLALRTRRIVNVPLLVATAITAGLTYLSINPSAMPITYDQRLTEATATAGALQDVYQARAGQHAVALGASSGSPEDVSRAADAIEALEIPAVNEAWQSVQAAHDEAYAGGEPAREEAAQLLTSTQEAFESAEAGLRAQLDRQLDGAGADVGIPAGITSGAALLLGLVGAVLAWTGLSQRLKEYR